MLPLGTVNTITLLGAPMMADTRIVGGIEWFTIEQADGTKEEDCQCARCGSSVDRVQCWNCGGEGFSHHDCGEDCCCCLYPEDNVPCDICEGKGGWWRCISSPEWCEAHPMPGRESIKTTAYAGGDDD